MRIIKTEITGRPVWLHPPFTGGLYLKKVRQNILPKTYCVYPEEIEVVVGLKDPTIYVSSNYQPGDFWYALTLRHEQVHQWINKLTLEYFLPLFYKRIIATAREVRAVKVNSGTQEAIDAGYKKVYDYYLARLKPVAEEFRKVQKEEQHKLDNKMNYAAEAELFRQYEAKQKLMNQKFD